MNDSLSIAVHDFASRVLISFLVDDTLRPWLVNLSTSFRELEFSVEMSPLWLKHIYSVVNYKLFAYKLYIYIYIYGLSLNNLTCLVASLQKTAMSVMANRQMVGEKFKKHISP